MEWHDGAGVEPGAEHHLQQHANLRPGEVAGEERTGLCEVTPAAKTVDLLDTSGLASAAHGDSNPGGHGSDYFFVSSATWVTSSRPPSSSPNSSSTLRTGAPRMRSLSVIAIRTMKIRASVTAVVPAPSA